MLRIKLTNVPIPICVAVTLLTTLTGVTATDWRNAKVRCNGCGLLLTSNELIAHAYSGAGNEPERYAQPHGERVSEIDIPRHVPRGCKGSKCRFCKERMSLSELLQHHKCGLESGERKTTGHLSYDLQIAECNLKEFRLNHPNEIDILGQEIDDSRAKVRGLESKYQSIPADERVLKTDLVMMKELIILRKKYRNAEQRWDGLESKVQDILARYKKEITEKSQEYLAVKRAIHNISGRQYKIHELKRAAIKKDLELLNLDIGEMQRRCTEALATYRQFRPEAKSEEAREAWFVLMEMLNEAEKSVQVLERGSIPAEALTVSDLRKFHAESPKKRRKIDGMSKSES